MEWKRWMGKRVGWFIFLGLIGWYINKSNSMKFNSYYSIGGCQLALFIRSGGLLVEKFIAQCLERGFLVGFSYKEGDVVVAAAV